MTTETKQSIVDAHPLVLLHYFGKPHDGLSTEETKKKLRSVIGGATKDDMIKAAAQLAVYLDHPDLFRDYLNEILAIHNEKG